MTNQHNVYQNPDDLTSTHSEALKGHFHPTPRKHRSGLGVFLVIILVLGGLGIKLESDGITNVVPAFGKGGRPSIMLGLWHFNDVSNDYWAKPFIEGLIQGSCRGTCKKVQVAFEGTFSRIERVELKTLKCLLLLASSPSLWLTMETDFGSFWTTF